MSEKWAAPNVVKWDSKRLIAKIYNHTTYSDITWWGLMDLVGSIGHNDDTFRKKKCTFTINDICSKNWCKKMKLKSFVSEELTVLICLRSIICEQHWQIQLQHNATHMGLLKKDCAMFTPIKCLCFESSTPKKSQLCCKYKQLSTHTWLCNFWPYSNPSWSSTVYKTTNLKLFCCRVNGLRKRFYLLFLNIIPRLAFFLLKGHTATTNFKTLL